MYGMSLRGVCLLLCWSSVAFSVNRRWLQPGQGHLSKTILLNFQKLHGGGLFPTGCLESTFPPNIDFAFNTTQVDTAVLTVCEVTHQIHKFYSNVSHSLRYNREYLEPFLTSLHHQIKNLKDCNSVNLLISSQQRETRKAIREYFGKLEEISLDKNNTLCARHVIRIEVQKQLQLTAQLMTQIRKSTF